MKERVSPSSAPLGERRTSCTIGGAVAGLPRPDSLRCRSSRFFWHSEHSPPAPGAPPQAHLRCNSPLAMGAVTGGAAFRACAPALISSSPHTPPPPPAAPPSPAALPASPRSCRRRGAGGPRLAPAPAAGPARPAGAPARAPRRRRCGGDPPDGSLRGPAPRCGGRSSFHPPPHLGLGERTLQLGELAAGGAQQMGHAHGRPLVRRQEGRGEGDVADVPAGHRETGELACIQPLGGGPRREDTAPDLGP